MDSFGSNYFLLEKLPHFPPLIPRIVLEKVSGKAGRDLLNFIFQKCHVHSAHFDMKCD
jgi:hypothetical protein